MHFRFSKATSHLIEQVEKVNLVARGQKLNIHCIQALYFWIIRYKNYNRGCRTAWLSLDKRPVRLRKRQIYLHGFIFSNGLSRDCLIRPPGWCPSPGEHLRQCQGLGSSITEACRNQDFLLVSKRTVKSLSQCRLLDLLKTPFCPFDDDMDRETTIGRISRRNFLLSEKHLHLVCVFSKSYM